MAQSGIFSIFLSPSSHSFIREILAAHTLGDTLVRHIIDPETQIVGLELVPSTLESKLATPRETLRGEAFMDVLPGDDPWPARPVESLIQFKLVGDPYPGAFAQGHTLRNSEPHRRFK